jgi:predicted  nucleic acid-binding Zn-ribbon protein
MTDVLQRLANLQFIDSRLDELRRLRGDLPEELLDMEADIARMNGRIQHLKNQLLELEQEKATLEQELKDGDTLIRRYEEQQMTVRNNREYDALTKEIDAQKQSVENARARLEDIRYLVIDATDELAGTDARLVEVSADYAQKKGNLSKVIAKTQQEEDELQDQRDEAAKAVEERYIRSYERLRKGLNNGIAVVAMDKKGSCLGMMLPPQVQMEVRKKATVITDENSGRIVLDPSFFEEAEKQFKN